MNREPAGLIDSSEQSFEQLPLEAKRRVDAVCARFEAAWTQNRSPAVEEYLVEVPAEERAVLLEELLHIEIECRKRRGESPRHEDYRERLPGYELLVRTILSASAPGDHSTLDGQQTVQSLPPGGVPQVPGYEVMGELGRGGMGVVYKARHLALKRLVALKFILSGERASLSDRKRFRREAEVFARLRHPNIIQIYDIGEIDGQVYLALEFAECGSLRDRLAGSILEPRAAAMLLEPLTRAVQHAHRLGVIHRDLKPANVLLAPGGDSVAYGSSPLPAQPVGMELHDLPAALPPLAACTPKLTDFGLAKVHAEGQGKSSGSMLGRIVGTPSYMAPEQVGGAGDIGPAVDIWALGATLYELLTGQPPFRGATAAQTLQQVLSAEPMPPRRLQPGIPRALETICLNCLRKSPADRYSGARELAQDLRHFLDGEAIQARGPGLLGWSGPRMMRLALLLALVVGVLAGLALAVWW